MIITIFYICWFIAAVSQCRVSSKNVKHVQIAHLFQMPETKHRFEVNPKIIPENCCVIKCKD